MRYREALLQTKRMGGFCKWCNADVPMPAIAARLGTRPPWLADPRYRRAWTRWVTAHLKECEGNKAGRPMDSAAIREQVK